MKKRSFRKPTKVTKNRQYFNTTEVKIDLKRQKRKRGERIFAKTHENIIILSIIFVIAILLIVYKHI